MACVCTDDLDPVAVRGVDPAQRRHRDEVVAEVAERVHTRPVHQRVGVRAARPRDKATTMQRDNDRDIERMYLCVGQICVYK